MLHFTLRLWAEEHQKEVSGLRDEVLYLIMALLLTFLIVMPSCIVGRPAPQALVNGAQYTTKWCEQRQDGGYYAVLAVADEKDSAPRLYRLDFEPPMPGFVWDKKPRPVPIDEVPVEVESAPAPVPN